MCLLASVLMLGPRVGVILYWLGWPARWDVAFDTAIVPLFGVLFVPWTTLTWIIVAPSGVVGFDYVWLGLAFLLDLASLGGGAGAFGRRSNAAHQTMV